MSNEPESNSQISDWYSGKCVFITGATGFLGKVLMEKLLRSCPDINTIYILLRSKRGVRQEERLTALLKDPLYDIIRKNNSESFKKIVIINGDVMQQNLGICPEDRAVLAQNVSVVFHSAATVKFNEPLPASFGMNVMGTKEMIILASDMKNLQAFVHISTAFSNCNRMEVEEKLYDPPIELNKLVQVIELFDDDTLNYLTPKLLKGWPNTYTFTKACAEHLVSTQAELGRLPAVIVRPSIVTAAWQEPLPGWLHNFSGLTGMFITAGKGICRAFPCQKEAGNFIPVDVVVNLMVAVGWHVGVNNAAKVSKQIDDFLNAYEYFTLSSWKFHSENIPKLLNKLSEKDKIMFNFDVRPMNWDEYLKNYHLGIKKYVEKDNMDDLPKARANLKRLEIIYYIFNIVISFGFIYICFKYIFNIHF